MTILRFLNGAVINLNLPISYIALAEIVPLKVRGKSNIIPVAFDLLGHFYCLFSAMLILDSMNEGNWHLLVASTIIPTIIVLFGNLM